MVGGKLKLADFGVSAQLNENDTYFSRNGQVGTTRYMAPEQIYQPERANAGSGNDISF